MAIDMQPGEVKRIAGTLHNATDQADRGVTTSLAPSLTTATATAPWQSASALRDCATAWQNHLSELIGRTHQAADRLRTTSDHYAQVDQRLTKVFTDLHP
ncbi:hypothetical protein GCM10010174_73280 [Kutzneria viridogrisea]|nr:type VII secretion target [Kutzneria albida]MBA8930701.1 uncharacterized protein YukE [Kutzneria viridogrisea]